jgi:hypothetical protein
MSHVAKLFTVTSDRTFSLVARLKVEDWAV